MKKILLSILSVAFVGTMLFAQTKKFTLVEEFTQASCPPCEQLNPLMEPYLQSNVGDNIILLKYHTSWPGFDPMNEQNPDDVQDRVDAYGVTGVPAFFADGNAVEGSDNATTWEEFAGSLQDEMTATFDQETPIAMTVSHTIADDLNTMSIAITLENTSADDFSAAGNALQVAIVEEDIQFPEPPGTTSEDHFLWVMRKMLPSTAGSSFDDIPAGGSITIEMNDVEIPSYIYNFNEIGVVAFIQGTAGMVQAGMSTPVMVDVSDISARGNTLGKDGLCEYEVTPGIRITNDGTEEITEVVAAYTTVGGSPVIESWTGSLLQGQWNVISFPAIQKTPGSTVISYEIISVNGGRDGNSLNNVMPTETYYNLSPTPMRSQFAEPVDIVDFGEIPADVILINPDDSELIFTLTGASIGLTTPIGGFGNSDGAFAFDFFGVEVGQGLITFDKVDLSNSSMSELRFTHAYAQYTSENDRLEVVVSTDCGDNWTSVWNQAGSELATAPASEPRFFPESDQWRENTADLSAYDGQPDVTIAFRGTSAWGNMAYIDDVTLGANLSDAEETNALESAVEIFPNPVATDLVINLQLENATPVTAEVFDLSGKKVATIENNANYPAGTHTLNWNVNNQSNGMYMVKIRTEVGEITKKISVLK